MKRKKVNRLHSEDARFIRELLLHVLGRVAELEILFGELQLEKATALEPMPLAEIIEA